MGACEHLILERGYWFDVIAGVSAGAVNGGALAQAHDPGELAAEFEHLRSVWFGMRGNHDVYRRRWLGAIGTMLARRSSLYHTAPLRGILERHIDPARVKSSPIRLRVGYVDLHSGTYRRAANDHAELRDVILASCALPLVFPPVPLADGAELGVDGGTRRVTPLPDALDALSELPESDEPDEIWVLTPNIVTSRSEAPCRTWLAVALRTIAVLTSQTFREDEAELEIGPTKPQQFRVRLLHPRAELEGPVLAFEPERIRAWYDDGLRTARMAETWHPEYLPRVELPQVLAHPEEEGIAQAAS